MMMKIQSLATVASLAFCTLWGVAANATVHDPYASSSLNIDGGADHLSKNFSSNDLAVNYSGAIGLSSGTIVNTPAPYAPSASISGYSAQNPSTDTNNNYATATSGNVLLEYTIENDSEPRGSIVPFTVSYALGASSSTTTNLNSSLTTSSASIAVTVELADGYSYGLTQQTDYVETNGSKTGVFDVNSIAGVPFIIDLSARETTYADESGSSQASAYVDPIIAIDPAYLAAHPGATFSISPGIGNGAPPSVAGVPEPSTWMLMLAGVAGLGLALRGSRRADSRQIA